MRRKRRKERKKEEGVEIEAAERGGDPSGHKVSLVNGGKECWRSHDRSRSRSTRQWD